MMSMSVIDWLEAIKVNDANRKLEAQSAEKMSSVTAGLPGGLGNFKLPF